MTNTVENPLEKHLVVAGPGTGLIEYVLLHLPAQTDAKAIVVIPDALDREYWMDCARNKYRTTLGIVAELAEVPAYVNHVYFLQPLDLDLDRSTAEALDVVAGQLPTHVLGLTVCDPGGSESSEAVDLCETAICIKRAIVEEGSPTSNCPRFLLRDLKTGEEFEEPKPAAVSLTPTGSVEEHTTEEPELQGVPESVPAPVARPLPKSSTSHQKPPKKSGKRAEPDPEALAKSWVLHSKPLMFLLITGFVLPGVLYFYTRDVGEVSAWVTSAVTHGAAVSVALIFAPHFKLWRNKAPIQPGTDS